MTTENKSSLSATACKFINGPLHGDLWMVYDERTEYPVLVHIGYNSKGEVITKELVYRRLNDNTFIL